MKKRVKGLLVLGMVIAFLGFVPNISLSAEATIELKVANYQASTHHASKALAEWVKMVEAESKGRLRLTVFSDASLLSGPETWSGTVNGVADIGLGWVKGFGKEGMSPYHYSVITFAACYGAENSDIASKIADEIAKTFPPFAQETAELKLLATHSMADTVFYSQKYRIRSIDDFKGRTVRSGNKAMSDLVKALGGNPLFMSMGEVYMALNKGTIDVMAGYPSTLIGYKHAEVAKYITKTGLPGGSANLGFVGMNWDTWKKLPDEMKKVIEKTSPWLENESRQIRVREMAEGLDFAKSKGCEIIEFSKEDKANLHEIMKTLAKKEAQEMDAKGLKGTQFLDVSYRAASKYIK